MFLGVEALSSCDKYVVDKKFVDVPGRFVFLPKGSIDKAPAYWRVSTDPRFLEISTVLVGLEGVREKRLKVPRDALSEEHYRFQNDPRVLSQREMADLAWSLSFAWRAREGAAWTSHPMVRLSQAREIYERLAKHKDWVIWNNLAVMLSDGIGGQTDQKRAFELFKLAVQFTKHEEPVPLRHLRHCYAEGIGVQQDILVAQSIDRIIVTLENKKNA